MSASAALTDLRARLDRQFPDAIPVPRRITEAVATGVAALDAILPNGGFPKGRLSVWTSYGGATAVLKVACLATVAAGERAVWIDGAGTIVGPSWTTGPLLVRPSGRVQALRAAELLVRSGGFALVILSGIEPAGTENVRLSRAAHDSGSAVVALTTNTTTAGVKLTSRLPAHGYGWRQDAHGNRVAVETATLHLQVQALGWQRTAVVHLPVQSYDPPAALIPTMPDRRGTVLGAGMRTPANKPGSRHGDPTDHIVR